MTRFDLLRIVSNRGRSLWWELLCWIKHSQTDKLPIPIEQSVCDVCYSYLSHLAHQLELIADNLLYLKIDPPVVAPRSRSVVVTYQDASSSARIRSFIFCMWHLFFSHFIEGLVVVQIEGTDIFAVLCLSLPFPWIDLYFPAQAVQVKHVRKTCGWF